MKRLIYLFFFISINLLADIDERAAYIPTNSRGLMILGFNY